MMLMMMVVMVMAASSSACFVLKFGIELRLNLRRWMPRGGRNIAGINAVNIILPKMCHFRPLVLFLAFNYSLLRRVTRFGEISLLWQNFKNLLQFLRVYKIFGKILKLRWQNFVFAVNSPILNQKSIHLVTLGHL